VGGGRFRSLSVRFGEEKTLWLLSGSEPYLFGYATTSSVNTPTHILGAVMSAAMIPVVIVTVHT
jgi:hypothetical protein